MKKLLLTVVIAASLVACNSTSTKKDGSADSTKTENKAQEPEKDAAAPASSSDVPKFSNAEIQKLAEEYATFMKEYIAAYQAKDNAKIAELGTKFQEYGTSTATTLSTMSAGDAKLWTDYFTKVTEDMTKAMTQ